jgi:hypothetical protein
MQDLFAYIEGLDAVRALKISFFAYPLVNALHILAIGALLTGVMLMDIRLLGAFRSLPEPAFVSLLRRVALGAFALAVLTGITLFAVRARDYAASSLFVTKIMLIAAAGANFAIFSMLDHRRAVGQELSGPARLCVSISLVVWPCVLLAGRFLGFV